MFSICLYLPSLSSLLWCLDHITFICCRSTSVQVVLVVICLPRSPLWVDHADVGHRDGISALISAFYRWHMRQSMSFQMRCVNKSGHIRSRCSLATSVQLCRRLIATHARPASPRIRLRVCLPVSLPVTPASATESSAAATDQAPSPTALCRRPNCADTHGLWDSCCKFLTLSNRDNFFWKSVKLL